MLSNEFIDIIGLGLWCLTPLSTLFIDIIQLAYQCCLHMKGLSTLVENRVGKDEFVINNI